MNLIPIESGLVVDGIVLVHEITDSKIASQIVEADIRGAWLETIFAFAELSFIEPIISLNMTHYLMYLFRKSGNLREENQNILSYIIFYKGKDTREEQIWDYALEGFEKAILSKLEEMAVQFEAQYDNEMYNYCTGYDSFKQTIASILNPGNSE